ncbi:YeeE/YedE family protein [Glaciecola sp. XM2]|jgi:uncharacterized membrane protein YedE/YeeE|uniref:DUF6691 family protein n=1 Tax=Glaciecola sp. XM2 TaxID=1914931 RepID=UPI001BDF564E|nr:DUF6691 family protein [Glaciecola sp. XM2]MBT1451286.1 YeeE/YedE family protein [Glaciecola sp. XM2]
MKEFVGLIAGIIFGIGLTVSQMVNPQKVKNFLDLAGSWDPSLMFVMGGALITFGLGYWLFIKGKKKSLLDNDIPLVSQDPIDAKLLIGASIFGIGWGISGVCPGPAIANVGGLNTTMLMFIVVMIVGLLIGEQFKKRM